MSRRRRRTKRAYSPPTNDPEIGPPQPVPLSQIIGMISVKTIRSPDGTVIVRQGERIREEIFYQNEDAIIGEIIANAMPGGSHAISR